MTAPLAAVTPWQLAYLNSYTGALAQLSSCPSNSLSYIAAHLAACLPMAARLADFLTLAACLAAFFIVTTAIY